MINNLYTTRVLVSIALCVGGGIIIGYNKGYKTGFRDGSKICLFLNTVQKMREKQKD